MEPFDSPVANSGEEGRGTPPSQTLYPAARLAGVHIKKWFTTTDKIPHQHEIKRLLFSISSINVLRDCDDDVIINEKLSVCSISRTSRGGG